MRHQQLILLIVFSLIFSRGFSQNSWYVSENGDAGTGAGTENSPWATITNAMNESNVNDGDTIHINGTITQDGDAEYGIQVMKDLIFKGISKETSIIQAYDYNASADRRVFTIWDVAEVVMINLTVRNGYFPYSSYQYGAGILNWGNLTLKNCIVSDNYCDNEFLGGGIYNQYGTLHLEDTYVVSNYSYYGGAGIVIEGGITEINNSTIALNYTQSNLATGAGIYITKGTNNVSITNSTIYYNLMGFNSYGCGIHVKADGGNMNINILNTTIADNEAGDGSFGKGIFIENETEYTVNLSLKNCIVSNSNSENYGQIGAGTISVDRTYTICRDASMSDVNTNGNIDNSDPLIETFEDHGGNTFTCSLNGASPAINAGTNEGSPETDQRGMPRVGITDIGSFEYQSVISFENSESKKKISILPNPAENFILINYPTNIAMSVNIIDICGRTVFSSKFRNKKIDISKFASGVYYVEIFKKNYKFSSSFIKR